MKKKSCISIVFLILFICISHLFAQPGWEPIKSPTNKFLRFVYFVNDTTGWAVGDSGIVIKTTNSGNDWFIQQSNVTTFVRDVYFLNENLGWALTIKDTLPFGSVILKTTNGGGDWTSSEYPEENTFFNSVIFFDSLNGLLGGEEIVRTTDGGKNWVEVQLDSSNIATLPKEKFEFYNSQYGYACGGFRDGVGIMWKTTDGGQYWTTYGVASEPMYDLLIQDSLNILTISGDPEGFYGIQIVRSSDAGETWENEQLTLLGLAFGIDARNSEEIWCASATKFLYSGDAGKTWEEIFLSDSMEVYDVDFPNENFGIAVGSDGLILKYTQPSSVDDQINLTENGFILAQNYPNPFNPATTIKWKSAVSSRQTIKLYDVLGKEVAVIVDKELPAGSNSIEFDASDLPDGIYFYRLTIGSYSETKKMVLLK